MSKNNKMLVKEITPKDLEIFKSVINNIIKKINDLNDLLTSLDLTLNVSPNVYVYKRVYLKNRDSILYMSADNMGDLVVDYNYLKLWKEYKVLKEEKTNKGFSDEKSNRLDYLHSVFQMFSFTKDGEQDPDIEKFEAKSSDPYIISVLMEFNENLLKIHNKSSILAFFHEVSDNTFRDNELNLLNIFKEINFENLDEANLSINKSIERFSKKYNYELNISDEDIRECVKDIDFSAHENLNEVSYNEYEKHFNANYNPIGLFKILLAKEIILNKRGNDLFDELLIFDVEVDESVKAKSSDDSLENLISLSRNNISDFKINFSSGLNLDINDIKSEIMMAIKRKCENIVYLQNNYNKISDDSKNILGKLMSLSNNVMRGISNNLEILNSVSTYGFSTLDYDLVEIMRKNFKDDNELKVKPKP